MIIMKTKKQLKEVVCVLNPEDIYYMKNYMGEMNSHLVTPYEIQEMKDARWLMPSELQEGSIVTRHPYKNEYIFLNEQTEDEIALARINVIGTILSYLGAKNFKVCQTSLKFNDEHKTYNVGADASAMGNEGSGKFNYKKGGTGTEEFTIKNASQWPGTYTVEGYKKACEIAKWSGLDKDSTVAAIIEQRNPKHGNALSSRTYQIDVRSDLEQYKNISVDLKEAIKRCNVKAMINGSYESNDKSSRHNTFDFEVEFGPLKTPQSSISNNRGRHNWLWWLMVGVIVALAVGLIISLL